MTGRGCPSPSTLARAISQGADPNLRAHLLRCPTCAEEWRGQHALRELGRSLPAVTPEPERRQQALLRLKAAALGRSAEASRAGRGPSRLGLVVAILGAGTVAALCAVGAGFLTRPARPVGEAPSAQVYFRATIHPVGNASFIHERRVHEEIVRLSDGTLQIDVDPLQPGERFRVLGGDGEIEVRGTSFTAVVHSGHLESVTVLHGRVEVRPARGGMLVLGGGDRWGAPPATPQPSPAPLPPTASVPAATRPTPPLRLSSDGKLSVARVPPPAPGRPPRVPESESERLFAEGWAALGVGRYQAAASAFERSRGQGAATAIAVDAHYWQGVALARADQRGEAIRVLGDFVRQHEGSPRLGEASLILGWQLVREGHPEEASGHLRRALADPRRDIRESARAGLAAIAAGQGPGTQPLK